MTAEVQGGGYLPVREGDEHSESYDGPNGQYALNAKAREDGTCVEGVAGNLSARMNGALQVGPGFVSDVRFTTYEEGLGYDYGDDCDD